MVGEFGWPLEFAETELAEVYVAVRREVEQRHCWVDELRGRLVMILCPIPLFDLHNPMYVDGMFDGTNGILD